MKVNETEYCEISMPCKRDLINPGVQENRFRAAIMDILAAMNYNIMYTVTTLMDYDFNRLIAHIEIEGIDAEDAYCILEDYVKVKRVYKDKEGV